jgi:CRP-like cAMP-binding protein
MSDSMVSDQKLMERTLRAMPAFADWPAATMSRLLAFCKLQWHPRGESLSGMADATEMLVLVSGYLLYTEPFAGGVRSSWTLLGPGLLLGFSGMLGLEDRFLEYVASDEVVAIHIHGRQFFDLLDGDSTRWRGLGHMLILQDLRLGDLIVSQMAGRLSRRLAETIEKLADRHGTRSSENNPVRLRLAQHDLAAVLRVSRQSVNKELLALASRGVVELKYNGLVILDPVALRGIARPPPVPQAAGTASRAGKTEENSPGNMAFMSRVLRAKQVFSPWSAPAMERLLMSSRVGRHPRGCVVGVEEYVLIVSGIMSVGRVSPEGKRFGLILFGPGDLSYFKPVREGAMPVFHGIYNYIAMTDVVAIHMPMRLILETLDSEPLLWKEALQMSARQQASYIRTVYGQVTGSLRQRVASTVLRLAALHGMRAGGGEDAVHLPVSQANLAAMLQANRQAVHKELQTLAAAGAIGLAYNAVTVLDQGALRLFATSS